MLTQLRIQRYKSLYDVTIDLEPLTVFIGPNGSGKSNVCEAIEMLSIIQKHALNIVDPGIFGQAVAELSALRFYDKSTPRTALSVTDKFWRGLADNISFTVQATNDKGKVDNISLTVPIKPTPRAHQHIPDSISNQLKMVRTYDFNPAAISLSSTRNLTSRGEGIANSLRDILLDDRERFSELEERLIEMVPNASRISLKQGGKSVTLSLIDRYSDYSVPMTEISDGTLRILALLTSLYQTPTPTVLCFEEPENGIHPWLLHKVMELLQKVAKEGITGQPVQILITTHSPVLLNYAKPEQIRAVELDDDGKTQTHALPTDSKRFQLALDAYEGKLGELWFTNVIGGNPA